jgi:hypothetical protein
MSARRSLQARSSIAIAALTCLACDPADFPRRPDESHAAAGKSGAAVAGAGASGATDSGSLVDAGPDAAVDSGSSADSDAAIGGDGGSGMSGAAGASGSSAGAGGAAAGSGGRAGIDPVTCPTRSGLAGLKITASELGAVIVPAELDELSAGPGIVVQGRVLWLLGTRSQGPFQGRQIVVTVTPANLQKHPPQLDDSTSAQLLFPDEPANSSTTSIPTSVWLAADGGSVQYFFSRYFIFASTGAALAESTLQTPSAKILSDTDSLFPSPPAADGGMTDSFRPKVMAATTQRAGIVYTHVCQAKPGVSAETDATGAQYQPCRVGRVPAQLVADSTGYQFWDGSEWQNDFGSAKVVLDHVAGGLTVEYNSYLGAFLAVYSGSNNNLILAGASTPQGPFQQLGSVDTVKGTGGALPLSFAGREIIGLRQDCQRSVYVSYGVPLSDATDSKVVHQETHVLRIDLQ